MSGATEGRDIDMRDTWSVGISQIWIPYEWVIMSRGMRTLEQCLTDVQHVTLDEQPGDITILSLTEEMDLR